MILFKLEVKCHKIQDNNLSTISFQQGLKMEGQGRIKDLVYEGATILPPPNTRKYGVPGDANFFIASLSLLYQLLF